MSSTENIEEPRFWISDLSGEPPYVGCYGDAVVLQPMMKVLFRPTLNSFGRVIVGQHFQQRAAHFLNRRGVRLDFHAGQECCVACGRVAIPAFDLDDAQTARAARFEPVIVTERGHVDPELTTRSQDAGAFGELALLPVDSHLHGCIKSVRGMHNLPLKAECD
jgi:hypothetical protein